MKRTLILSMMLVLGFTSLSTVSFAQEDGEAKRDPSTIATGDDPNDLNSKTFGPSGTQAGTTAIGTKKDCPTCDAHAKQMRLGADTNFRKGSTIDFKKSQEGAQ
jgi:hypothetical protein